MGLYLCADQTAYKHRSASRRDFPLSFRAGLFADASFCGKSLSDYFDMQFFSYRMKCSKPSRGIYQKMLEQGRMKADETLFVDDGAKNIEAAANVGIRTLHVKNGADWRLALDEMLEAERG